jgi:hypothetical protein
MKSPVFTGLERFLDRPDRSGTEFTPAGPDRSSIFLTRYNSDVTNDKRFLRNKMCAISDSKRKNAIYKSLYKNEAVIGSD